MPNLSIIRGCFFAGAALLSTERAGAQTSSELRLRLVPPDQASIDLSQLSFQALSELIEGAASGDELVLPLPVAGTSAFDAIEIQECEVTLDSSRRTLVLAGRARVRGLEGRVFLSGTFPASGPGQFAFGVRPDELRLAQWFQALEGTPLANLDLANAALVLARAPHTLPSSKSVDEVLGNTTSAEDKHQVQAGIGLRAMLATKSLPAVGQLFARLGIDQPHLPLTGGLGTDADSLLVDGIPKLPELELHGELNALALDGLRKRLPGWVKPTGRVPTLDLSYSSGAGLVVGVSFQAEVEVAGQTRAFEVSGQLDADGSAATLTLRGRSVGAWERPLGIEWLSLKETSLVVTLDGDQADAKLFSDIRIGAKEARLELALDDQMSARLTARVDRIAIGDLAAFVSERTGSSFLRDLQLGDAAQLESLVLTLARVGPKNSLEVSATAALGDVKAELLFTLTGAGKGAGKAEPQFALRRRAGHLSDLLPALAGKPANLELPQSIYTLSPANAAGKLRRVSSAELTTAAREFYAGVYGSEFELELAPGIHFGATLPVAKLPPALLQALGISDRNASLVLEGSLAMNLDLEKGRPSANIQSLELHAALPRVAGATSRLPEGLPSWMRPDSSSQRTLTVRYSAPSSLTFLKTNDVLADLGGQTRHFRIATEVGADSKQGSVALSGAMVGEWKQPFGFKELTLRDVTIATNATAETGAGGKRSGGVVLEGGFDLGSKSGRMQLEITAASGSSVSGSFTGTLDSLSFGDLPRLELFPNLPKDGLERLGSTLGKLPPLEEPTIRVALGGGQPSVTLSARTDVRGARAHLLVFAGKGPRGLQAVIAIRPENFSLAKLFPKLGENPLVAPLAQASLDNFGLFAVLGDQTVKASEVDPSVRDFFADLTGDANFELELTAGLNLEARIPPERLPDDLAQGLERLNKTMGFDSPQSLSLRGTIGASLADLRLAAALPPLRPNRAPKWLKSGELAIVLTGKPSLMLGATLVVDCEGDILNLTVEGGVERQGANVAIALKSALQADEAWTSPFGMEWLEIRRFSGQISIDALANVGLGGGGDVTIGSKDIKVFAWTKINSVSGIPMGLVIKGESKAGLALLDLADLQRKMRQAAGVAGPTLLPLDQLPDIALRDFALLIASRAVPEEDIDSAGFKLKGDLYIPLKPGAKGEKFVTVDCEVSKEGIVAKGSIAKLDLGPVSWKDSLFDLEATLAAQHLIVDGQLQLLGSSTQTALMISRDEFSFATSREIAGLWSTELSAKAAFDLKNPRFKVHGALSQDFMDHHGPLLDKGLLDFAGPAAALGLDVLNDAESALNGAKEEFGIATPLETLRDAMRVQVDLKKAKMDAHKVLVDAAYKAWKEATLLKNAKWAAYSALKHTYDEGPLSKVKQYERAKDRQAFVCAQVVLRNEAKWVRQELQRQLQQELQRIGNYSGKKVTLRSASFDADLDGLLEGSSVQLALDLTYLGQAKPISVEWKFGSPAENLENVQRVVAQIAPVEKLAKIEQQFDARVEAGLLKECPGTIYAEEVRKKMQARRAAELARQQQAREAAIADQRAQEDALRAQRAADAKAGKPASKRPAKK